MRNNIHPNVWVNALLSDYKPKALFEKSNNPEDWKNPNWIITDTRFPNEADAIRARGGIIIRTTRQWINPKDWEAHTGQKVEKILEHISETALDNYKFDYVINNSGTIEQLIAQVIPILTKEGII